LIDSIFLEVAEGEKWCIAMDQELQALEDNGTWRTIELPKGKHVIGCNGYIEKRISQMDQLTNTK